MTCCGWQRKRDIKANFMSEAVKLSLDIIQIYISVQFKGGREEETHLATLGDHFIKLYSWIY